MYDERLRDKGKLRVYRSLSALALASSLFFAGSAVNNIVKQNEIKEKTPGTYMSYRTIASGWNSIKIPFPSYIAYNEIEKSRTWVKRETFESPSKLESDVGRWAEIDPPIYKTRKEKDAQWDKLLSQDNQNEKVESVLVVKSNQLLRESVVEKHAKLSREDATKAFYHLKWKRNALGYVLNLSGAALMLAGSLFAWGASLPHTGHTHYYGVGEILIKKGLKPKKNTTYF